MAFNARGPDGLIDGKAPGARPRLDAERREVLRALVEQGPIPAAHAAVRWRLIDLAQILFEDHGVSVSEQTLSRVLRGMGYRKLSARPRPHAQDRLDHAPALRESTRFLPQLGDHILGLCRFDPICPFSPWLVSHT